MRNIFSSKFSWMFMICAFAINSISAAQASGAAEGGQQPSACAAPTFCYDTPHFAAAVTTFRTSTVNGYKIIDTSIRFQNKTDRPLVLGYVNQSGFATDDRGNRSIVGGPNGVRGIGLVAGNNFDPKLVVRPLSSGEAQFELFLQGGPQIVGFHYALDISVSEIKTLEGNQHVLDGEFPLHFEGLTNGVSQGAGSLGAPDGLAGAVSNLKSIFGKKKAAQNTATVANSAAVTAASVNAAANSAAAQPSSAAADNTLGRIGASSTAAQVATSTATGATASTPAAVSQIPTQQGSAQQQIRQGPAKTARQPLASAQPAAGTANVQVAGAAEPWTPPTDNAAEAAALVDPLKLPDVAKMPDVVGVHPGMSLPQALQILHGQYPRDQFQEIPYDYIPNRKLDYGFNILRPGAVGGDATEVIVSLTAPPSHQVVWRIVRYGHGLHASHANVLAALREKYGKESFAGAPNGSRVTDDRNIGTLWWIFDEHGNRAPMPSAGAFGSNDINFCVGRGIPDAGPRMPVDEVKDPNWCASFVGVMAQLEASEIVERTTVDMMDLRLANRTANAFAAWKRDADARARAADLDKSKKNKPVF